jgi:hypothetical protein
MNASGSRSDTPADYIATQHGTAIGLTRRPSGCAGYADGRHDALGGPEAADATGPGFVATHTNVGAIYLSGALSSFGAGWCERRRGLGLLTPFVFRWYGYDAGSIGQFDRSS